MSSISPRLLTDTLNLITLARETALARGNESQAARLTTVVDGLREATHAAAQVPPPSPLKPAAIGPLAHGDFQALLAATQAAPLGLLGASAAGERATVAAAMAAGGMPEVDIARQLGITREEVGLMVARQALGR